MSVYNTCIIVCLPLRGIPYHTHNTSERMMMMTALVTINAIICMCGGLFAGLRGIPDCNVPMKCLDVLDINTFNLSILFVYFGCT